VKKPAAAEFAIKIWQNPALARFGKSKSGKTLKILVFVLLLTSYWLYVNDSIERVMSCLYLSI